MIWLLTIPVIGWFTFNDTVQENWLMNHGNPFEWPFLTWVFTIFVGAGLTALISLAPIGVACFIGSIPKRIGRPDKPFPLVALREKDGVTGHFYFLGAGSISDTQYYFWYRRAPNGAISGGKTYRESGVRIYEISDGSEPRMVTFHTEYVNPSVANWIWLVGLDTRGDTKWLPDFYIPKGSIKEGYEL